MKAGVQFFLFTICLLLSAVCAKAQIVPDTAMDQPIPPVMEYRADTMAKVRDSFPIILPNRFEPIPKRAGLYSAVIPGMGQVYNRQYWKLPIVYAALGTGVYFIQHNLKEFRHYRAAYITRIDFNPNNNNDVEDTVTYNTEALRQLQDNYRRDADISILVTGVLYIAQILDAVAAAHLRNFDISRDISIQMRPMVDPRGVGFGLVMNFK